MFIPALQEIWSGPAKNSAVMAVMTSTPRLASHYRGEAVSGAVIVTALRYTDIGDNRNI